MEDSGGSDRDERVEAACRTRCELVIAEACCALSSIHQQNVVVTAVAAQRSQDHLLEERETDVVGTEDGRLVTSVLQLLKEAEALSHAAPFEGAHQLA